MKLKSRAALVTGGSRGLGRALARELGRRGARVAIVAREGAALDEAVAELTAAGIEVHAIASDVGDKHAIHAIAARAQAAVGPIDVVVNNASTLGPVPLRLLSDTDCEDLERALQVNLVGPFRLTKALVGAMVLRRSGLVVNVSSDAAVEPYPRWGAYAVSKAALDHLTRIWAAELGATGVRVIAVDPGEMRTRMHADALPDADPATLADPAAIAKTIADMIESGERAPTGSRLVAPQWSMG